MRQYHLLAGKEALITGAGQGIGRAIALEYAAEGAHLILFERKAETLEALREELLARGCSVTAHVLDITDYPAVTEAVARSGPIDILVNNAGIFRVGTILEDTLNDWRHVLHINLEALYYLTKQVAPHMVKRKSGRIINLTSIAGWNSRGNVGSYNASKGAVIAFTKSLAVELAPYNILVNAIAPGFVRTAQMSDENGNDLTEEASFREWYVERRYIPLGRVAEPTDVAGVAIFLASDYCRYMTGEVLTVDGGLLARR